MDAHPARPGLRPMLGDVVAAACAGAATLVVEIAVVRAVAPWFGQGPYVWANAVGVTLLALALGAAVGGRWAARDVVGAAAPWVAAASALWLGAAASAAAPLAAWLVPVDVAADRPLPLSLWASLVATVVLVGPPVVALGALPPVLVARAGGEAGRAAGRVSAAGTLGALLGCAATGPWLVPALGARGAIAAGALLAAVAALGTARPGASRGPSAATAGPAARARAPSATWLAPTCAGLLVTILEFTAFRALTPVVGGTNATFAASIAAVLSAGALGAWWGGGAPDGGRDRRRATVALGVGMATLGIAALVARGVAGSLGAFAGALVGFGPALFAAGATGPVSVRLRVAAGEGPGRAAGAVLAASTAASLAGCYLTPLVLLPVLGVRFTLLVALALGGGAMGALRLLRGASPPAGTAPRDGAVAPAASDAAAPRSSPRTGPRVVVAGCVVLATVAAVVTPRGPLRHDDGQVEELETAYQTVRSVETRELVPVPVPGRHPLFGGEREVRTRFLRFDEDATSYQSVALPDDPALLTAGRYYDHMALGAWLEGMPWTRAEGDLRVLIVGYCGGTLHRTLLATAPAGRRVEVVGIELDPAVTALARRHLGPFPEGLELYEGRDAREVIEGLPETPRFDLVLVDAYQRTQYVPFQLATREFFRAVRLRLQRTGAIAVNMNAPDGVSGALLDAVATSMGRGRAGHGVWLVPNLQYTTNAVVWGTEGTSPPRLSPDVPASLAVPAFTFERFLVRSTRKGTPLTDDRAPVEQLADEALLPVKGLR